MIEPVKVSAPIAAPSDISIRLAGWMSPGTPMPKACGANRAPAATSTAARPTSEWKKATSCGILVISMRRASTAPKPPPISRPKATSSQPDMPDGGRSASVVRMAIAMPIMP